MFIDDNSPPGYPAIYLIKSIKSEQIFEVVVALSSGGSATHQFDFSIGGTTQQMIDFPISAESLLFSFQLFDDENLEGREEATLGIQQQEGSVADFDTYTNVNTRLVILDDGHSKYF